MVRDVHGILIQQLGADLGIQRLLWRRVVEDCHLVDTYKIGAVLLDKRLQGLEGYCIFLQYGLEEDHHCKKHLVQYTLVLVDIQSLAEVQGTGWVDLLDRYVLGTHYLLHQ